MAGPIAAHRLVTLPRLSAPTALALGTALMTVLRLQIEVPERLHRAGERLERSLDSLRETRQLSVDAQRLDHDVPRAADVRLDAGWASPRTPSMSGRSGPSPSSPRSARRTRRMARRFRSR